MIFDSWTSLLEILAVASGLAFALLAALGKYVAWWFGLFSSALYVAIALLAHYYLDVLLNAYYLGASFFGIFHWQKMDKKGLSWQKTKKKQGWLWMLLPAPLGLGAGGLVGLIPGASLPLLDGLTTFYSFAATLLLAKKQRLGWAIFVPVDLLMAAMYAYKGWHLTAAQFILLSGLAWFGWHAWKPKEHETS